MIVKIGDPALGELVDNQKVYGKTHYPVEVIKAFKRRVFEIKSARNTQDLRNIKSLHFEKLKGKNYEGKYSIRLNIAYRVIFRIENEEGNSRLEIICIEEISNHYA